LNYLIYFHSRYIGRLLSESFCERVLSVANRVVTTANTSLSTAEVELVVMLRMNTWLILELFAQDSELSKSIDRLLARPPAKQNA
jgi:hypothetical protein